MGQRCILLDGARMTDKDSLHAYLREQMALPDYYGKNFDALYDVLTDIGAKTRIVLKHTDCLEDVGWFGCQVLRVFREAADDNCHLDLVETAGDYEQSEGAAGERLDCDPDLFSGKGEEE